MQSRENPFGVNVCMANMDAHICNNLAHKVRTLMTCELISIHLLPTKYLLNMKITVPEAFKASYKLFQPITIPTFDGNFHHELTKVSMTTVFQYTDKPEIVLLNKCDDINDILLCQASQSSDQLSHSCLSDIINHKKTKCWSESYSNEKQDCFVKKYANGLLVSTNKPLEVHAHSPGQTFNSKSSIIQGVNVIQNSLMRSYSIACSRILVFTNVSKDTQPKIVKIHNHRN